MTVAPAASLSSLQAPQRADDAPREPLPDLVIDRFDPDDFVVDPGDRVYFDVTVRNAGAADSPAFNVELSGWGIDREKVRLEGLPAGESAELRMGPLRGDGFTEYYFADVRADVDREVPESNERNNRRSTTLMGRPFPRPPQPPIPPVPPRPPRP